MLETSVLRPAAEVPTSKRVDVAHLNDEMVLKPASTEVMRARRMMTVGARERVRAFFGGGRLSSHAMVDALRKKK